MPLPWLDPPPMAPVAVIVPPTLFVTLPPARSAIAVFPENVPELLTVLPALKSTRALPVSDDTPPRFVTCQTVPTPPVIPSALSAVEVTEPVAVMSKGSSAAASAIGPVNAVLMVRISFSRNTVLRVCQIR